MNGPTADIQVGSFIRQWVISNTGSDTIRLDKRANLWGIVKEHLEIVAPDWAPVTDRSEYISIELLDADGATSYNRIEDRRMYINELFRCCLGEEAQAKIRRYLENQFRNAFRIYMTAAMPTRAARRSGTRSAASSWNTTCRSTRRSSRAWRRTGTAGGSSIRKNHRSRYFFSPNSVPRF